MVHVGESDDSGLVSGSNCDAVVGPRKPLHIRCRSFEQSHGSSIVGEGRIEECGYEDGGCLLLIPGAEQRLRVQEILAETEPGIVATPSGVELTVVGPVYRDRGFDLSGGDSGAGVLLRTGEGSNVGVMATAYGQVVDALQCGRFAVHRNDAIAGCEGDNAGDVDSGGRIGPGQLRFDVGLSQRGCDRGRLTASRMSDESYPAQIGRRLDRRRSVLRPCGPLIEVRKYEPGPGQVAPWIPPARSSTLVFRKL